MPLHCCVQTMAPGTPRPRSKRRWQIWWPRYHQVRSTPRCQALCVQLSQLQLQPHRALTTARDGCCALPRPLQALRPCTTSRARMGCTRRCVCLGRKGLAYVCTAHCSCCAVVQLDNKAAWQNGWGRACRCRRAVTYNKKKKKLNIHLFISNFS